MKVRKPKKKKAKLTRQKAIEDDDIFPSAETVNVQNGEHNGDQMQIDSVETTVSTNGARKRTLDETFVDDEDLQAALAIQRRNVLKKRKKMGPEGLARQIREEATATPVPDGTSGELQDGEEGGLIIDETSEFVANIQKPSVRTRSGLASSRPVNDSTTMADSPPAADEDGDAEMSNSYHGRLAEADHLDRPRDSKPAPPDPNVTSTGLDNEITLNAGIGSTLTMLSQRGLLDSSSSGDLNSLHRERQKFLAEKQRREAEAERRARLQRERDRASGKLDRMSAREKEAYAQAENKQRDQYESRQMADIFNREYKPDIEIKYTDEFGRSLNQKEAFKHLSHQFHGKGSGKQKTERRLKKIDEEKKRESKSVLDGRAETGMGNAMGVVSKTSKVPGIRLQ